MCNCEWCDGNAAGYAVALAAVEVALEARKGVREEAAGIEAAMEEIEKLRADNG